MSISRQGEIQVEIFTQLFFQLITVEFEKIDIPKGTTLAHSSHFSAPSNRRDYWIFIETNQENREVVRRD